MSNTLEFRGMGAIAINGVDNCRIRTEYIDKNNKKHFVELTAGAPRKTEKSQKPYIFCDFDFINEGEDPCNNNHTKLQGKSFRELEYNNNNILAFINNWCNGNFTDFVII